MAFTDQSGFEVRCEFGLKGLEALLPVSDVIVIVDVLSFSTAVDVAVARGATVFPYRYRDRSAAQFAASVGAHLADPDRSPGRWSLSPASLLNIPPGTRLVLPSPNGATLALACGDRPTFAGSLRNATAVAHAAQRAGERVAVIAAGERWPDGTLRAAVEDGIGAGAIINALRGSRSPEAQAATATFLHAHSDLAAVLRASASGKELLERDLGEDIECAADLDCSQSVPRLHDQCFRT